jgi:aldose 1-epimerase
LDDPRFEGMHRNPIARQAAALYQTVWRRHLMRSGLVTVIVLGCALAGLTIAYRAHMQGNFHKLKAKIATERPETQVARPGGQEAVSLVRTQTIAGGTPEFLSATLLPGRGMNLLQITAYIPGRGEIRLLQSPSVEDAAQTMSGTGADADGQESLRMGAAFESPWAGQIWGGHTAARNSITTSWRGHQLTLPATSDNPNVADGGLMLKLPSLSENTVPLLGGGQTEAVFDAADFGGRWPSKTVMTVTVLLSSKTLDLTVKATNDGNQAEPIGIGWQPRFVLSDGARSHARLRIPGDERVIFDNSANRAPTGSLEKVAGTPYDFGMPGGARIGNLALDDCFTSLRQELLDPGPVAELSESADGYGIRMTMLSPTIKAIRVVSPNNANYVSIEPQFNYSDPFGHEWGKQDTGMVILQPGQSTEWKVRLELFRPAGDTSPL